MQSRLAVRIKICTNVALKIQKTQYQNITLACGNEFKTLAFDISNLGLGIYTNHLLPKDLMIDMVVDGTSFGLEKEITIRGKITYCKSILGNKYKYKCGVKFLDPTEKNVKTIAQSVNK